MIEIVMAPDQNDPWQTPLLANGSLLCILTWTNTHTHTNWRITSAQIQGLYWHWLIEAPHGVASPPQFVHFHSRITKLVDYYVSSVATAMLSIPKWSETVGLTMLPATSRKLFKNLQQFLHMMTACNLKSQCSCQTLDGITSVWWHWAN